MHNNADRLFKPLAGSLAERVVNFFAANLDEELTTLDIAEKFDHHPGHVTAGLRKASTHGLLICRKCSSKRVPNTYLAGPRLRTGEYPEPAQPADEAGAPPPPAPAATPAALARVWPWGLPGNTGDPGHDDSADDAQPDPAPVAAPPPAQPAAPTVHVAATTTAAPAAGAQPPIVIHVHVHMVQPGATA